MPKDEYFNANGSSKATKDILRQNAGYIRNRSDRSFAYRNRRNFRGLLRKGTLVTIRFDDGSKNQLTLPRDVWLQKQWTFREDGNDICFRVPADQQEFDLLIPRYKILYSQLSTTRQK